MGSAIDLLVPRPFNGAGAALQMNEADQLTNLELVMGALEQIGLVFSAAPNGGRMIEPGALLRGSPRELLLFSMYLYQSLPHYVPKTTLEFSGGLHTPLAKTLELSNPSKKPITYAVRLEGAPCFRLPADSVQIASKGSYAFPVEVNSRLPRTRTRTRTLDP